MFDTFDFLSMGEVSGWVADLGFVLNVKEGDNDQALLPKRHTRRNLHPGYAT